jgi:hypothetical protein
MAVAAGISSRCSPSRIGGGRTGAEDGADAEASWISAQIGHVRSALPSDCLIGAFLSGATAGEPSATTWLMALAAAGAKSQSSMWLNVKRNWTARAAKANREPNRIFDRNQRIFSEFRAPPGAARKSRPVLIVLDHGRHAAQVSIITAARAVGFAAKRSG